MSPLRNVSACLVVAAGLVAVGARLRGNDRSQPLPTQEVFNFKSPGGRVGAVAFSGDGETLLVATSGIDLLDATTGKRKAVEFDHPGNTGISGAALSPDGKWIVTAASGLVKRGQNFERAGYITLFDATTGKKLADRECHGKDVTAVAFVPDGKVLVTGGQDSRVRLWDPAGLKEKANLGGHGSEVTALAISTDGKLLATAEREGIIRLWALPAGEHRATLRGHRDRVPFKGDAALLRAVAFSPDGRQLVSGDSWGHVAVWDVAKHKATAEFAVPDGDTVYSVAFAPGGKAVAIGGKNKVRFWSSDGKTEHGTVTGHANGVYCLTFGPGGRMATGDDFRAYVWAVPAPK